ncbi:apolipophorins [Eupeodes corollae]|uniref:apolipophorins n=1 Tax=Eupeodes corollae TaxID=290404 RepID=UPI0024931B90|nr:apolipophorins [Eupeodes corollae]
MWSREPNSRIILFSGILCCLIAVNGLNAEKCKTGCPKSDSGLLKYVPGNVYEYSIESLMTVGIDANDAEEIALKLSGHAKLYAEGNCGYTLQMERMSVSAVKESIEKQIIQNLNKPIKFTMVSGELQPEICSESSDNAASLNIKRGIISLLQAADKPHETDVFGVCPTLTSVSKAGSSEIITKVRNLNACSYREKISNGLINGVVNSKAGIKSTALLKSDYSKELKLNNGIPENIQLVEEYKLAPMSNGAGVSKAKVKTTLRLGNVGRANAPPCNGEPASIIFEPPTAPVAKNIGTLKKVFTNTVNLVNEHVQGDAAKHFTELIRLMRSSDVDTLIELSVVPHVNKVLARKVYLDALFRVGTSNSVKAIVRQISKFSENEKKLAFMSFNLVQSIEKDALNQAATLLNPNSPKEAFLAIGNLVNKYCKLGTCDQSEVNVVSKKFTDSLKHCKANTKKDEDRYVSILKGIRNTHKIADASAQILIECASADRSARLRVAAIQAFTASACDAGLQSMALNILKDRNEDSEIRIEAYLAAIACPNAQLANEIAEIVNSEPVYQVGGFITSSLKAIRDSTDPTREASRIYLGNIRLTKKFPIDSNRYSFNSEVSYAIDSLGLGASADYSLIYSQKGFLPRSARLNLTSQIFGTNFNVLEVNTRQENLEDLWGHYFGPKGALRTDGRNILSNLVNKSRPKRSIVDDAEKLSQKYNTYGSKVNKDINLDMAVRLFGSEMFFLSLGDDIPQTVEEIMTKFSQSYDNVKNGLKNFEHEYACHSLFLDTEFVYPTGMGIPLELAAQGTSASKLSIATEVDIDAILAKPQEAKYRIKFVPSVDVSVNAQFRFNALVLAAGLQTASSLHSSVGEEETFEFTNGGHGFNLDVVFPRESLELIDLKHNVDFVVAEQDKETKVVPLKPKKRRNAPKEICFDQLNYIGMTICFTSVDSSDAAELSFTQPKHIALRLQTEKKINIVGSYDKKPNAFLWKLKYSTPGSQIPHNTELNVEAMGSSPKSFIRASLEHPEIRLSAEAGLLNNEQEILLYGQYDVNGDKNEQKIGLTKNGNEYRPLIEVTTSKGVSNEINGIHAEGRIIRQENGNNVRFTFDNFQIITKDNARTIINGWADMKPFKSELKIRLGKEEYVIKSHFSLENGYSAGMFVQEKNSPHSNGASIDLQLVPNSLSDNIVVAIADYKFEMQNQFDYSRKENKDLEEMKFKNQLKLNQGSALILQGTLNGEVRPKLVQFAIEAARGQSKASLDYHFAADKRASGDYSLDVNAKLNQHYIDLKSRSDIKGVHYVIENSLTTSWGTKLTAKGEVGQRMSSQDAYIDLQGTFIFTPKDKQGNWLLKVLGTADKTSCDFKLVRDSGEITFNGESNHPQDKITNGKLNLQVKDQLVAKADFKINKGGKGELTAIVNLKKAQRKINIDSKFNIATPKYDIETTIGYDNDKKIYVKTENVMDKTKTSTKTLVDINGDKYLLEGNAATKGEKAMNGEVEGMLSLTMPNGRQFDGQISRKITTAKTGIAHGSMTASIGDKLPNNERRSIEVSSNLEKYNKKTNEYVASHNIVYTNFAGKKLDAVQKIKHLLQGNFKSLDCSLKLGGELLTAPIDVSLIIDEYCPKHAIFRVSGKYGDQINANVNGNYDLGARDKPASYELQINVAAPQTNLKAYSLATSGKYLRPETENGVRSIELHFDQRAGDKSMKINTFARGNSNHGTYSLDLASSNLQAPLKLDGSFSTESQGKGTGKSKYNLNFSHGENAIKSGLDVNYVESNSAIIHLIHDSTWSGSQNKVDLVVRLSKVDDTAEVKSDLQFNGQKYSLESQIFTNEHKKGATIKVILPQKTTTVSAIIEKLGELKGKVVIKIDNLADLDYEQTLEANLNAVDDFYITSNTNSKKLKIDDYSVDIRAQANSGGKGVEINVKNAKSVIISGSATYIVKHEKTKTIIEGQGQIQYYQKTNNANFKIIHQLYDIATDKEIGSSLTFNGTFGPKNAVSTLKMTNKNFHVKLSVCEEKKQCTNVEVRSIITTDSNDITSAQHDLMVLIDLRELGYPHEFELQSKSSRKGLKFNHEIESNIISNSNIKYQLVASITPSLSKVQVKLPSREILIETEHILPENILGHYQSSATFYSDRLNKPNDITKLVAIATLSGVEKVAINAKAAIRFENPNIRTLSVSGQADANYEQRTLSCEAVFDIFKTPEQKIIASSNIKDTNPDKGHGYNITTENVFKSSGLGFQYEASAHSALSTDRMEFSSGYNVQSGIADIKSSGLISGSKDRLEVILTAMNEQLVNLVAEYNSNKHLTKVNGNFQLLSLKPLTLAAEIDQDTAKVSLNRAGLIDATADIKLGKEAKITVNSANKKLISGRIGLDSSHFLVSTFESNRDDIKVFLKSVEETIAEDTKSATEHLKKRFQKIRETLDHQTELLKNSAPDFSALQASLEENVNAILKDLENDPAIQQIIQNYHQYYETAKKLYHDMSKTVIEAYKQTYNSVKELLTKIQALVKDTILPIWEEFAKKLTALLGDLQVEVVKFITTQLEQALKSLSSVEADLKALTKPIYEALKPIADSLQELVKTMSKDFEDLLKDLKEYLAKLPTFDALRNEIKKKLAELKTVDEILSFLRNIIDQLSSFSASNESTELAKKIYDYIEAKLRGTQVNDIKSLEGILNAILNVLSSVWKRWTDIKAPTVNLLAPLPISLEFLKNLPTWISFRFSLINYLINENVDLLGDWADFFKEPFNMWSPFDLHGHIADGKNVFTFDGRQFAFQGSCKYVIAQDADSNDFSVIGQFKDGKLKSMTLIDSKNFVEISDNGALKHNGKPAEYPVHASNVHAWRRYYTIRMRNENGVEVTCTADLKVCHVTVDAFYTSKMRGLLGNGNAEPYDDFINVEGKIAENRAEFVNAYGVGNCPAISAPEVANLERDPICSEIFSYDSYMFLAFLLKDPTPFRKACDEAVVASPDNKEEIACNIALTYASAALLDDIAVALPERCLKCSGAAGQREINEEFTTKIPTTKADIVFVVDLGSSKNVIDNLVTPAISEIRSQLKTRGMTDVQIVVVAFSDDQLYPALLTSNGGKINFSGKLNSVTLNGPSRPEPLDLGIGVVNDVLKWLDKLENAIKEQSDEAAFNLAMEYPFRAGAARSIVAVRSDQLDYSNIFKILRSHLKATLTGFEGSSLHLIAPVKDISVEGVPPEKLVGFNSRIVATTEAKDAKKRQKLKFKSDMGVDFVLQNNGWIFAAQNFEAITSDDQKKAYVNQVTSSIADTLFKTEIVSECKCTRNLLRAEHKCKIVSSNFVPNKRPKGA